MSTLITSTAALILIVLLIGLSIFQILLAIGRPYGRLAYGGANETLPTKYRIMSVLAVAIFSVAIFFVLIQVEVITNSPFPEIANIGLWFFAFYLGLNTLANATSKSESEKKIMTPISLIASICFFIIALGL